MASAQNPFELIAGYGMFIDTTDISVLGSAGFHLVQSGFLPLRLRTNQGEFIYNF